MARPPHGVRAVAARQVGAAGEAPCWVVEEAALVLAVEDVGDYTLMWTPTEPVAAPCGFVPEDGVLADGGVPEILALAVGFAFSEGLFASVGEIRSLAVCADDPAVVRLVLADPGRIRARRRNVTVASSCGICGGQERIEDLLQGLPAVGDSLRLETGRLDEVMATMRQRQAIWLATGGTHAAAIFDGDGRLLVIAEDLGRHNALDKAIGHCLLAGLPLAGCGAVLTSRVTLEMAAKAARAGLELVAAVSAASSLAIEAAERLGITLCGFVRNGRATVFSHGRRLLAGPAGADAGTAAPPRHIA